MLTGVHYIYALFILIVLIIMILKKDTIIPCILGIFFIALYATNNFIFSIGSVFNSFIIATKELMGIIMIISIIVSLSKLLEDIKATEFMIKPFIRIIKNKTSAFFSVGFVMLVLSWFFWPSPSTALVGAIFLPVAIRVGLPAIGVAVAINLFGHGLALSTDYIIQGAPTITATAAGIDVLSVIKEGTILYWTMAVVSIGTAYYMLHRDMKNGKLEIENNDYLSINQAYSKEAKISAVLVTVGFILDVVFMFIFGLKGSDATALVGGTAIILLIIISFISYKKNALDKITVFIKEGFVFGIQIFAPIIPIAAFFYMGELGPLTEALGKNYLAASSQGILSDIGLFLSNSVPMNKFMVATIETTVGAITGLDGSGFSGMALAGSLAKVFGAAIKVKMGALTALGQIAAIWVGGGTIVPWGLIPAAAICGVSPMELAKRNFIPVITGLIVTTIVAIFII